MPPEKTQAIAKETDRLLQDLNHKDGWPPFIKNHPGLFESVSAKGPTDFVGMGDILVSVEGHNFKVPMGCRSVFIKATPHEVVSVIDTPESFKALYGLDKPSTPSPKASDGSYEARIYKLVPGIETQDYTLKYTGHWEGPTWIGQASQVRDEKNFAWRENFKIVEPVEGGSVFREVALFLPLRWWMDLFPGTVQSVTKKELAKINLTVKCAAEHISGSNQVLSDDAATNCHKAAEK